MRLLHLSDLHFGKNLYEYSLLPDQRHWCGQLLEYLDREGFAYRQDIARVLRIGPRQCWPILQRMLAEHQIAKDGQKYILLQKEA